MPPIKKAEQEYVQEGKEAEPLADAPGAEQAHGNIDAEHADLGREAEPGFLCQQLKKQRHSCKSGGQKLRRADERLDHKRLEKRGYGHTDRRINIVPDFAVMQGTDPRVPGLLCFFLFAQRSLRCARRLLLIRSHTLVHALSASHPEVFSDNTVQKLCGLSL